MIRRLFLLITLLAGLSQMAVTCQGTETGNPGGMCPAGLKSQTTIDPDADMVVDDLILDLCRRIVVCGVTTTIDTCFNALNGPSGDAMIDKFGAVTVDTVQELRQALQSAEITTSISDLDLCEDSIRTIDCTEVARFVTPPDFSQVQTIIPLDCSDVFKSIPGPSPDVDQPGVGDGDGIGDPVFSGCR